MTVKGFHLQLRNRRDNSDKEFMKYLNQESIDGLLKQALDDPKIHLVNKRALKINLKYTL